ncbi:MAG: RdgB/HAM1 family non-canonical purine NTP pyrophosphatase [Candidatus Omnitrophota bacterium]
MVKVLIATHNTKKRSELKTLLKELQGVEVLNLNDLDIDPPMIVEDGKTFRQNAVKKAITISRFFDGLVLGDDSGLEVEALDGKPGVRSARFARKEATDTENNKKLLRLLDNVPAKNRDARFVCCIAMAKKGKLLGTVDGFVNGEIIPKRRGKNGFGYDPLFVPEGYDQTFAEMEAVQKNKISHRALALNKAKTIIEKYM